MIRDRNASAIMKHKLLYLCALFVGLGFLPLPVSALSACSPEADAACALTLNDGGFQI